jgi:NAD(P)-dependent dehydrogenase (short-subunit alcohol dehydrogenase family)
MRGTRQVALVTGASSGIGKAAAIAMAAAGFQVIGTGRNTARLTAPAGVTYLDLDVTNDESPQDVRPRTARGSHRRWFKRIEH